MDRSEENDINIDRALFSKSYSQFFAAAWKQIEKTVPLNHAWYIIYICNRLEDIVFRMKAGKKRKKHLIICLPPRTGKSYIVTKFFNAWAWTVAPELKFLTASYSASLSEEHSIITKTLIETEWYQKRWGQRVMLSDKKNTNTNYMTNAGGQRYATSVGASVTGFGGNILIADDLLAPSSSYSAAERANVVRWIRSDFLTRFNDNDKDVAIFMQQRTHENDPVGFILQTFPDLFDVISVPAEWKGLVKASPDALKDFYQHGLMDPVRFSLRALTEKKKILLPQDYDAQYNQSPKRVGGNIIKREYFGRFNLIDVLDHADRNTFNIVVNFAGDTAYTKKQANCPTVIMSGFVYQNKLHITNRLKVWDEIQDFVTIKIGDAVQQGSLERFVRNNGYTTESMIAIEPKASGLDIINTMKAFTGLNIVAYGLKTTDKVTALRNVMPVIRTGRILVPEGANWVEDFFTECEAFSADGSHDRDDQVDTLVEMIEMYLKPVLTETDAAGTYSSGYNPDWDTGANPGGIQLDLS